MLAFTTNINFFTSMDTARLSLQLSNGNFYYIYKIVNRGYVYTCKDGYSKVLIDHRNT